MGGCDLAGTGGSDDDFSEALQNYGQNLILPSYQQLQSETEQLHQSADEFTDDPTQQRLRNLREALREARMAWQRAAPYQFGPAEMRLLRPSLNTYPADTGQVRSNISSGDYDLEAIVNRDAAGFPALGYLLHGAAGSDAETVGRFTSAEGAGARRDYLLDLTDHVRRLAAGTADDWRSGGGNYIGTFLDEGRAGNDTGSSMGMLINALVLHFERFLRDAKIGIPSGIRSAGVPRPAATEAYYGGYSVELALASLEAMRRIYRGEAADGSEGHGLRDELEARDAGELASEIETELSQAESALEALSDPLRSQISSNNEPVLTAFSELQDVVGLLKADMTSILGITITYQDNDGD